MQLFRRPSSTREAGGTPKANNAAHECSSKGKTTSNLVVRGILSLVICSGFGLVVCLGHVYSAVMIIILISMAYYELVNLYDRVSQHQKNTHSTDGHSKNSASNGKCKKQVRIYVITNAFDLLSFITLETYFFITTMATVSIPWLLPRLTRLYPETARFSAIILSYHHLLSFLAFLFGIIKFILSLEKGRTRAQFQRFSFIIMSLLYVVIQSMMIIVNLYYGMIWFMLPHTMITLNDIMAYIFGKLFGRTPLISLSPKKTLEGFIGAFITTTLIIAIIAPFLLNFRPLICSVNDFNFTPFSWLSNTCEPESIYRSTVYVLPSWAARIIGKTELIYKPCLIHIMILTLFASLLAPFGGFLASGLKRAMKVKDFSDTIPGHGGMMDRFDCHILMGAFTYLYLKTFVRRMNYTPDAVMKVIAKMLPEDRKVLFEKLRIIVA